MTFSRYIPRLPSARTLPARTWLTSYDRHTLRFDLQAGIILAALAIPQALGYAAVAGVPVQVGLYTLPPARWTSPPAMTATRLPESTETVDTGPTTSSPRRSPSPQG